MQNNSFLDSVELLGVKAIALDSLAKLWPASHQAAVEKAWCA